MQTISTFIDKYFWFSILLVSVIITVANWFTPLLTQEEEHFHMLVSFMALAVIDIRKWLNK